MSKTREDYEKEIYELFIDLYDEAEQKSVADVEYLIYEDGTFDPEHIDEVDTRIKDIVEEHVDWVVDEVKDVILSVDDTDEEDAMKRDIIITEATAHDEAILEHIYERFNLSEIYEEIL